MRRAQPHKPRSQPFDLKTERLGPLPLINHFIARLGLEALLEKHVPTTDRRCTIAHARALGVLLRSIIVEREPIYRQAECVQGFAPTLYGLSAAQCRRLDDDRLGRALDRLFNADRAALLTEVVVSAGQRFGLAQQRFHNDSTSIAFCGQYRNNRSGQRHRSSRPTPLITYGFSKDHRPDLKQLLFILTTDADGGVPVQFRAADGNTNDAATHIESWNTLCAVAGRADFLYVADSKLCSRDNLDHIDRAGGRFLTVMPRSRREDGQFRAWLQRNSPEWTMLWDRPHPRYRDGPRDRWAVYRHPLGSAEGWSVIWVWSTLLTLQQRTRRQRNLAAASEALTALRQRLANPRSRLRRAAQIDLALEEILQRYRVHRYVTVKRQVRQADTFKQTRRGRPGPNTRYRRVTRRHYDIEWHIDQAAIDYDMKSDGMYPLLTNDRALSAAEVLQAHKGQPTIEKRFSQLKSVHEIAPVLLKNPARIEALFTLYFLALLVQGLIERELRLAMQREGIEALPIYPEQRPCKRPTTEQILRLFTHAERHRLTDGARTVQVFHPALTALQQQLLRLLGVPLRAFRG